VVVPTRTERLESSRHLLSIEVQANSGWRAEPGGDWWVLRRPGESLLLRTWRAGRLIARTDCERQMRLWRPETTKLEADELLGIQEMEAPKGFSTVMHIGVRALADDSIEGFVLAFGAMPGRCFAAVYETKFAGAGAEAKLGARLADVSEVLLPRVQVRTVADRTGREPPPF